MKMNLKISTLATLVATASAECHGGGFGTPRVDCHSLTSVRAEYTGNNEVDLIYYRQDENAAKCYLETAPAAPPKCWNVSGCMETCNNDGIVPIQKIWANWYTIDDKPLDTHEATLCVAMQFMAINSCDEPGFGHCNTITCCSEPGGNNPVAQQNDAGELECVSGARKDCYRDFCNDDRGDFQFGVDCHNQAWNLC